MHHVVGLLFRRLLCICFVAGALCAQEPTSCTVSGTIKDDWTGAPISKATLVVQEGDKLVTNKNADEAGRFTLKIAAGRYDISAWARGYGPEWNRIDCTATGEAVPPFDFALHAQALITGRVKDDENRPLRGATITALRREYVAGDKRLLRTVTTTAGVDGLFTVDSLPNGSYYLVAFAPRGAEKTKTSDVTYVPTFYPSALHGYAAAPISIRGSGEISGIDIAVRKARAFSVRGKLTMVDEQPSEGYTVELTSADLHSFAYSRETTIHGVKKQFDFSGVTPGAYIMSARNHGPVAFARAMVDVRDGDVEGIEMVLTHGNGVSAVFIAEGNDRSLLLGEAIIDLLSCGSTDRTRIGFRPEIDSKGEPVNYMGPWGGFPLLSYCVSVSRLPPNAYAKLLRVDGHDSPNWIADLTVTQPHRLEIVVGFDGGVISGFVRDTKDKPVSKALVALVPVGSGPLTTPQFATTDSDRGQYAFANVQPGKYKLFAFENVDRRAIQNRDTLRQFESLSSDVEVKPNAVVAADVKVIPAWMTAWIE